MSGVMDTLVKSQENSTLSQADIPVSARFLTSLAAFDNEAVPVLAPKITSTPLALPTCWCSKIQAQLSAAWEEEGRFDIRKIAQHAFDDSMMETSQHKGKLGA